MRPPTSLWEVRDLLGTEMRHLLGTEMRHVLGTEMRHLFGSGVRVLGDVASGLRADPLGWPGDALARYQPPAGQETAFLGLGGNLGDRMELLNQAVRMLHAHPRIVVDDISSVYETAPIGPSEEEFLNIAVRVLTDLPPMALLRACQQVEDELGRVRTVRWGARTMDVDILLYGDRVLRAPVLTVPHAELVHRAFALVPLLEVAPGWVLPDGTSLATAIVGLAPIEGITAVGRQVSLEAMPSGPPTLDSPPERRPRP